MRPRAPRYAMRALALLLLLAGCLDTIGPEVGPLQSARCVPDDSDPGTSLSYRLDIATIFATRCFNCHSPSGPTPIGLEIGGLNLTSYASLRAGGTQSGADIVIPGDPCRSILYQKLGPGPPFGSRMPLNGILSDAALQKVHDWIAEGALDN